MLELKSQKVWKILNAKQLKGAFVQLSLIILWPPSIPRLYGESFVFPCFACSHFVLDLILHLLGQSANFPQVCIRREAGYCSIGWLQSDDPDSFKVILIIFMNSMKLFLPSHFQSNGYEFCAQRIQQHLIPAESWQHELFFPIERLFHWSGHNTRLELVFGVIT